jgi:hypothetical protein
MQTVRMLSSQIHRMRAKGYGLTAIAELLSDSGFVVTAKTLKTYLGEARAAGGQKNRRKAPTHHRWRSGDRSDDRVKARRGGPLRLGRCTDGDRVVAKVTPAVTTPPAPAAPAVTPKGTRRPSDDASTRRSAFVPKKDTRDI